MAQIPKGRLVKGPYKPICRDCAIYFSITVPPDLDAVFLVASFLLNVILGPDRNDRNPGYGFLHP